MQLHNNKMPFFCRIKCVFGINETIWNQTDCFKKIHPGGGTFYNQNFRDNCTNLLSPFSCVQGSL